MKARFAMCSELPPGAAGWRARRINAQQGVVRRVRGVEVQVCPRCGESFLDVAALEQIDRALGLRRRRRNPAHAAQRRPAGLRPRQSGTHCRSTGW
ncbi:MAG: YgiT-type zinc finger protein [Deltaproteobacteria bacterium]|nr:YgiT-type zinc finger protein [Deltaproteobacteria bacterium]